MWTGPPPLPAFAVDRLARRNNKSSTTSAPTSPPQPSPSLPNSVQYHSHNLFDLLEPAVDGPPSPEIIRAFSQQWRQNNTASSSSLFDKHRHQQASSGSPSSLQFLNYSDCPSWERSFDVPFSIAPPLSRKSSGRSVTSSMQQPMRDRADSVQIFGKALFNRKPKSKRDSSTYSSSGSSSIYSQDLPLDVANAAPQSQPPVAVMNMPTGNHTIPSLFSRRKTTRDSILGDSDAKRKYQISAPYNFQHLAHTEKDGRRGMQTADRLTLQPDAAASRASLMKLDSSTVGISAEMVSSVSSLYEHLRSLDEDNEVITQSPPVSPSRRVTPLVPVRSQDRIARSPPRQDKSDKGIPTVPPRVSSRVSVRPSGLDSIATLSHDRPQTSGGMSQTSQLSVSPDNDDDFPVMRKNCGESQVILEEHRLSRTIPLASSSSNWPLTCPLIAASFDTLQNVPEEEDHVSRARSRASIISTRSSLRGSKSVPMMASCIQRAPSNASDTLGRLDMSRLVAQRTQGADDGTNDPFDVLLSDSWEDDIDYCYEHEAEADCNYAWDRPSLDLSREEGDTTPVEFDFSDEHPALAHGYLHPGHFDVPALSPVSQVSRDSMILVEAVTPTTPAVPTASANFSLPRADIQKQASRRHAKRPSHVLNYNEPKSFDLSPTLIIPGEEFQRQLSEEPEWYPGQDDILTTRSPYGYDEPTPGMEKSAIFLQSRDSASTVASMNSDLTGSDRHASTSTTFTRLTASTSSINVQGLADESTDALIQAGETMNISSVSPKKTRDDSTTKLIKQRKEPAPPRTRQRARTLSHTHAAYTKPSLQSSVQHYAAYTMSVSRI